MDDSKYVDRLMVYDTFIKGKRIFVPTVPGMVKWYSCGPTVYDAAHMGHARTYVTTDVIRRLMESHFGYSVRFVMNITDIDDKIILRAREEYVKKVLKDIKPEDMFSFLKERLLEYIGRICGRAPGTLEDVLQIHRDDVHEFQADVLGLAQLLLDAEHTEVGDVFRESLGSFSTILGIDIKQECGNLARHWELRFFEDMDRLDVERPTVLTRVSDYVPDIITFVENIIDSGHGYVRNGSVYFSVMDFVNSGYDYNKLHTGAFDKESVEEGSLCPSDDKKSRADFVLWKKSKSGEPAWDSPWGMGRPGWHIECSAMAHDAIPEVMDIHSGGIDLAFPHHENEIAQSESGCRTKNVLNYFMHIGHMNISGQKMSKSLKNFTTIEDVLKRYTSRQLRIFFLLHAWSSPIDYSESSMVEPVSIEETLLNFFYDIDAIERCDKAQSAGVQRRLGDDEMKLLFLFDKHRHVAHASLLDSFDTPGFLKSLQGIVSATRIYLSATKTPYVSLLKTIGAYMLRMFKNVGISFEETCGALNKDEYALALASDVSSFRDNLRSLSVSYLKIFKEERSESATLFGRKVLAECDALRDTVLPKYGICLEDRSGLSTLVKMKIPDIDGAYLNKE